MPRNVGYLVAISVHNGFLPTFILLLSEVLCLLIGITQPGVQCHAAYIETGIERHIHTAYLHISEINHCPDELVGGRGGDYLVFHLVVIGIHRKIERRQHSFAESFGVDNPHIVLCGVFRLQKPVAQLHVIEVVEGRHPEYLFIKGSYIKADLFKRTV